MIALDKHSCKECVIECIDIFLRVICNIIREVFIFRYKLFGFESALEDFWISGKFM